MYPLRHFGVECSEMYIRRGIVVNDESLKKMPETDADKKERVVVYLTPAMIENAKKLASIHGHSLSEFYRKLIEDGLFAYAEKGNKLLVAMKLLKDMPTPSSEENE